jgi:hypothetical protein
VVPAVGSNLFHKRVAVKVSPFHPGLTDVGRRDRVCSFAGKMVRCQALKGFSSGLEFLNDSSGNP